MKLIESVVIAVPVYNEEDSLGGKVNELYSFIMNGQWKGLLPRCQIAIADNNSSDRTQELGRMIEKEFGGVHYIFLNGRGKGDAIKAAWKDSRFDSYDAFGMMDLDLTVALDIFPYMLEDLNSGYDISAASRRVKGARVSRGALRQGVSWGHEQFNKFFFGSKIRDYQCGCKVINRAVRDNVVPYVESGNFVFDFELLLKASEAGYSINERAATVFDKEGSKVNILKVAPTFICGELGLWWQKQRGTLLNGIKRKGS